MEIKECYRVLELQLGASREEVEAAYCRLLERWHPDRVKPAGDPEGIREAKLVVEKLNEAYRTLDKVSPAAAKPAPANFAPPPGVARPAGRPTSAPPPRSVAAATPVPTPTPAQPEASAGAAAETTPPEAAGAAGLLQRHGRIAIIAGAVLVVLLLVVVMRPKSGRKAPPDPATTGTVAVTTNRADTVIEATRLPDAASPTPASFRASGEAPVLAGLPPGKYTVVAKSEGWPPSSQEVTVGAGQKTAIAVHFASGSLQLDSIPSGALVRWGENALGKTPLTVPALPAGECQLTLEYPSWPVQPAKVVIKDGEQTTDTIRLPHGRLIVESVPAGATVQLEAKIVGKTPLTLQQIPAGTRKITIRGEDFVPVAFAVTIEDRGEARLNPVLVSTLPLIDPNVLLSAVWLDAVADRGISPGFSQAINFRSRNGVVKNLDRKKLWETWLNKKFQFTGTIKSYDRDTGRIEFIDQTNGKAKYRVLAQLGLAARNDKEIVAQLVKGASFSLYGVLDAVEEPSWPAKLISIEFTNAEPRR